MAGNNDAIYSIKGTKTRYVNHYVEMINEYKHGGFTAVDSYCLLITEVHKTMLDQYNRHQKSIPWLKRVWEKIKLLFQ